MEEIDTNNTRSIHGAIIAYLESLMATNHSPACIKTYRMSLMPLKRFLAADHVENVLDVQPEHIEKYWTHVLDQNLSPHTRDAYLRRALYLFNFLEKQMEIFVNPVAGVSLPSLRAPLQPVPTVEDMEKLLAQPDVDTPEGLRDRAILELLYSAGIRRTELEQMDVGDVDLTAAQARIHGKGGKDRIVPLGRQATSWITRYLGEVRSHFVRRDQDTAALWLSFCRRNRMPGEKVSRMVRIYSQQAGLKPAITTHSLRRACATHMLRNGANPIDIQTLLGHSTPRSLSPYLRLSIHDLQAAHAQSKPGE